MIRLDDVHKSFGLNHVLRGISLAVHKGESRVVIGGSGSGKSVILKHIIGIMRPDSGKVLIGDADIASLKEQEAYKIRSKFGMLFQMAALFDSMNVWENVGFALTRKGGLSRSEIREIAIEKLKLVGLMNVENLMPSELSGGMKKRVGLARAIAHEPEILLYDEPTTGLDPITADAINELILDLGQRLKVTSVAITHDMQCSYKIGDSVETIGLFEGRARVRLRMDPGIRIYRNARASIRSAGLLGDRYLDIRIGTPDAGQLMDGDAITDVMEVADMDDLARNIINVSQSFTRLTESLNEVLGDDQARSSLRETIVSLRDISATLNRTITLNDQRLRTVLNNISMLTLSLQGLVDTGREPLTASITNMRDFSASLSSRGPELIGNLNEAVGDLKAMLEENRHGIRGAVDSFGKIAHQVEKGEGTLGKLVRDDRIYDSISKAAESMNRTFSAVDRFRSYITFQAEYLSREKEGRASFDLTLMPDKGRYYILGVAGGPPGNSSVAETTRTTPGGMVREKKLSDRIRFNAQFGRRLDNVAARLGLFENTFGVGGDYYFHNDKGKIAVDVYDFFKNEEDSGTLHLKAGVSYFLFRNLFLTAGGDNLLSRRHRGRICGHGSAV